MQTHDFSRYAEAVARVAIEAADDPDAIMSHPEVVGLLEELAAQDLNGLFVPVAGDIDASEYLSNLAEAVAPYREMPLEEAPEVVEALGLTAAALQIANGWEQHPADTRTLATL